MTLDDQDIDALAEAVVRKQQRYLAPVLNADEAMAYVGKDGEQSFRRWRKKWRVPMCADGRYARRELDAGMNREARNRHSRKKQSQTVTAA